MSNAVNKKKESTYPRLFVLEIHSKQFMFISLRK